MKADSRSVMSRQQSLVASIFAMRTEPEQRSDPTFEKGLKIYRNNLLMTAARSLSFTYPVLEKMLGHEAMVAIAREVLNVSPPGTGDWADWGGELAEWMASGSLAEDYPYLPDMARLEWLMHTAARSESTPFEAASLSRLSEDALETVYLRLAPSFGLIRSDFPVDVLWHAHQVRDASFQLDETALEKALSRHQGACFLRVSQQNDRPRMMQISRNEYHWLMDVAHGIALSELIDRHPDFDFINWLPRAIQDGVLKGLE